MASIRRIEQLSAESEIIVLSQSVPVRVIGRESDDVVITLIDQSAEFQAANIHAAVRAAKGNLEWLTMESMLTRPHQYDLLM